MNGSLRNLVLAAAASVVSSVSYGQQDVAVDPAHHRLEFENDCVRVVRATFGPGDKAAGFFDARPVVIVSLTGSEGTKLNFPDGGSVTTLPTRAGQVYWAPAGRIQPENIGKSRTEVVVIEPKGCSN